MRHELNAVIKIAWILVQKLMNHKKSGMMQLFFQNSSRMFLMIQRDSRKSWHCYYENYGIFETWQPCNLVKDQHKGKISCLLSEVQVYLPARLNGEWNFDVTEWVTLSVDGAQTETPIIGIHAFQLRDVRGHFAAILALTRPIERFDLFGELLELGNDELAPESSWY